MRRRRALTLAPRAAQDKATGALLPVCEQSAGGASTCYLSFTQDCRALLVVNYWDSTLGVMPLGADGVPMPASDIISP